MKDAYAYVAYDCEVSSKYIEVYCILSEYVTEGLTCEINPLVLFFVKYLKNFGLDFFVLLPFVFFVIFSCPSTSGHGYIDYFM